MCKVVGRRKGIIEEKNYRVGIYYELSYIYTLHIEEVDMNKRSNVSLIYRVYEAEIRWTLTCTLRKD